MQKVAEKELDAAVKRTREAGYDGRGGAVVAMNPENGEILAMASRPDFDPQLFVGGISGGRELATFNYLSSDRSNDPFLNRAIVGGQPGASTFKIFTGIAGLAAGVIDAYTIVNDTAIMNGTGCWIPSSVVGEPVLQELAAEQPQLRVPRRPRPPEHHRGHRRLQRHLLLPGRRLDLEPDQG